MTCKAILQIIWSESQPLLFLMAVKMIQMEQVVSQALVVLALDLFWVLYLKAWRMNKQRTRIVSL